MHAQCIPIAEWIVSNWKCCGNCPLNSSPICSNSLGLLFFRRAVRRNDVPEWDGDDDLVLPETEHPGHQWRSLRTSRLERHLSTPYHDPDGQLQLRVRSRHRQSRLRWYLPNHCLYLLEGWRRLTPNSHILVPTPDLITLGSLRKSFHVFRV